MLAPQTPIAQDIVLTTLNSSYSHAAFGLRYLYANLEELQARSLVVEFTIAQKPRDIVEKILALEPRIVGLGVYIWNTNETLEVVSILKRVRPDIIVVLGGPEISFETEPQRLTELADFVICGEADWQFRDLCRNLLAENPQPQPKILRGDLPDVNLLKLPYEYFSDHDIAHRVLYVEASRGCPYKCEYCLSSLDKTVRNFPIELFLGEIEKLIARGARQFKFVDRTFNLSAAISARILDFFLERMGLGLFLHFELVPDRLPAELKERIAKFPEGSLQFEIGVQTWNPEVSKLVSRRQDYAKIAENFAYLRAHTKVHTHADLIVGLPGETLESFARGFDALYELGPDEIQVGILKRLKGTPIIRHDAEWQMVYSEFSPFQILSTRTMGFQLLQKMSRFSKFWDLYANSGNFIGFIKLLQTRSATLEHASMFHAFFHFCEFLNQRHAESHSIALLNLVESAWVYGKEAMGLDESILREVLIRDYTAAKKRDVPHFLRAPGEMRAKPERKNLDLLTNHIPARQARHLANSST